jgi:hypothetical protein
MKNISFIKYLCLLFSAILFSCSNDDSQSTTSDSELNDVKLVQTISNQTHQIEIYTPTGLLFSGYNNIYIRIKNLDGLYETVTNISWLPMMHMTSHAHSAPNSKITQSSIAKNTYEGYIVFQMPSNSSEYWDLQINYELNNVSYQVTEKIEVNQAANRNVQTFTGADNVKYVLAMVEPSAPKVAVNNIAAVLYEMKNMTSFEVANNYTIKIDPRMPSMGNHSSPNNQNLVQGIDTFYYGKLSLTMTGYWQINLQVINASNEVVKGEQITDLTPSSSIYFDLEF